MCCYKCLSNNYAKMGGGVMLLYLNEVSLTEVCMHKMDTCACPFVDDHCLEGSPFAWQHMYKSDTKDRIWYLWALQPIRKV